jgi:hypothetical protein
MIRRDFPSYRNFAADVKLERRNKNFLSGLQEENQ